MIIKAETLWNIRNYKTKHDDIEELFHMFNSKLFGKELPGFDEIQVKRLRGALGYFIVENEKNGLTKLQIHTKFRSMWTAGSVVCHEMVHHWQYLNGYNVKHNPSFYSWRDSVEKLGFNLSRSYEN